MVDLLIFDEVCCYFFNVRGRFFLHSILPSISTKTQLFIQLFFRACLSPLLSKRLCAFPIQRSCPTAFIARPDRFSSDPNPLSENSVRVRSRAKDQSSN